MKITHNKVGTNLNLKDTARAEKNEMNSVKGGDVKAKETALSDLGAAKVEVSERAKEMNRIKELAQAAPDVDEEKVARLQKLIDDGKYKVDAKDIADRMVDEHLSWS